MLLFRLLLVSSVLRRIRIDAVRIVLQLAGVRTALGNDAFSKVRLLVKFFDLNDSVKPGHTGWITSGKSN
ncbi:hypothetical protein WI57_37215 [Burkholderia cepacia]|nr:hypothetical protein WI51_27190 [Burkholderia cepacia]KVB37922.1 hypothetical protein WI57_37215 [Burkholderia cepacia]